VPASASIERRNASDRPKPGLAFSSSNAFVTSFTVASELTPNATQVAPAHPHSKKARARPNSASAPGLSALGSVTGREHHPIGVKLELRDLRRGEQSIILGCGLLRRSEEQRRLGLGQGQRFGLARQ